MRVVFSRSHTAPCRVCSSEMFDTTGEGRNGGNLNAAEQIRHCDVSTRERERQRERESWGSTAVCVGG